MPLDVLRRRVDVPLGGVELLAEEVQEGAALLQHLLVAPQEAVEAGPARRLELLKGLGLGGGGAAGGGERCRARLGL